MKYIYIYLFIRHIPYPAKGSEGNNAKTERQEEKSELDLRETAILLTRSVNLDEHRCLVRVRILKRTELLNNYDT